MATASCSYTTLFELEQRCPVPWMNKSQEENLHYDYHLVQPVHADQGDAHDRAQDYVIRRYLETLWIPESVNPLSHLVSNLRHVTSSLPADSEHPLHALLAPLLLTTRAVSDKYNVDLAQLLEHGGSEECELEESIMWYAWSLEKDDGDEAKMKDGVIARGEQAKTGKQSEAWRRRWLKKLEKRETKIQILLYLLALSLPGPFPHPPKANPDASDVAPDSPSKRNQNKALLSPSKRVAASHSHSSPKKPKISNKRDTRDSPTKLQQKYKEETQAMLESFMDKLAVWQLTEGVEGWLGGLGVGGGGMSQKGKERVKDDRDWTQVFCEDVVETLFKDVLPDQIALLRSKIFPTSPFDGSESDAASDFDRKSRVTTSRASRTESTLAEDAHSKSSSHPSRKRVLSRASSRASVTSSQSQDTQWTSAAAALKRSRSRSLSISLAQDEAEQRKSLVTGEAKRGILSREISMKRTAIARGEKKRKDASKAPSIQRAASSMTLPMIKRTQSQLSVGVTLVEDTPVKRQRTQTWDAGAGMSQHVGTSQVTGVGMVMVGDTPARGRARLEGRMEAVEEIEEDPVVIEDTPDRLGKRKRKGQEETTQTMQQKQPATQPQSQSQSRTRRPQMQPPQIQEKTQSRIQDFLLKTPSRAPVAGRGGRGGGGGLGQSRVHGTGMSKSFMSLLDEDEEDEDELANTSLTPKAVPLRLPSITASLSQHQVSAATTGAADFDADYDELADESFTESFGSPDVLLLGSSPTLAGNEDDLVESTPLRRRPGKVV